MRTVGTPQGNNYTNTTNGLIALRRPPSHYDPTHTTTLRNRFVSDMKRRFANLRQVIIRTVAGEDCFGLLPQTNAYTPGKNAYRFLRSGDKVEAFLAWLQEMVDEGILDIHTWPQIGSSIEQAWMNTYIDAAYRRGIHRGRSELNRAGYYVPGGVTQAALVAAFNSPFHADRVGLLYTRVYHDLKGITEQMSMQISRLLAQGMAEGKNPREIAKRLVATIDGADGDLSIIDSLGRFIPAARRAEMLARTEIIRSHHQAMMQEYRNWSAEGVFVKAEWMTAGDHRVCGDCSELEGRIYTLDEVENMIPLHPNCRCVALPVDVTDETRGLLYDDEEVEEW